MRREKKAKPFSIGIEGGGTKFNLVVANGPGDIYSRLKVPTADPETTLGECKKFVDLALKDPAIDIQSLGIGHFGPIQVNADSSDYGLILNTPKPGWSGVNVMQAFRDVTSVPISLDTDVNAAALGELVHGAGKGLSDIVYLTVGTGIGGGIIVQKKVIHGFLHPEIGHMRIAHDWAVDPFKGCCAFHGDCFEGLASGPAVRSRWGIPPDKLPTCHSAWDLEAGYIAQCLVNLFLSICPQRIILGGGVMQQEGLISRVRAHFSQQLNGYIDLSLIPLLDQFIHSPSLGQDSGVLGAVVLAQESKEKDP